MRRIRAVHRMAPLAAVILTMIAAEAAQAATVTLNRSCYSPGETIIASGTGFTPGQVSETLTLTEPGSFQPLAVLFAPLITTDAQGAFARSLPAPKLARAVDRKETATSAFGDADPAATTGPTLVQWTLSNWELEIAAWRRGRANPRGWMVIDTYGWTSAASILYAHYYRNLKLVKGGVRIGALTGECGDLRKRVRQFPFANAKSGLWKVYFTGTRLHDKRDDTSIYFNVRVPK